MWFRRKKELTNCYILHNTKTVESISKSEIFELFSSYFQNNFNFQFKKASCLTERYKDISGDPNKIGKKLSETGEQIIMFNLFFEAIAEAPPDVYVGFHVSRTNRIMISIQENFLPFDFLDFINEIRAVFDIEYGYSFSGRSDKYIMTFESGDKEVAKYVEGVKMTKDNDLERWGFNSEKIGEGYFRDVFPINVLSPKHLNNTINGRPISEVIKENKLGTLTPLSNEIAYWTLNENELKKAREIIYASEWMI